MEKKPTPITVALIETLGADPERAAEWLRHIDKSSIPEWARRPAACCLACNGSGRTKPGRDEACTLCGGR